MAEKLKYTYVAIHEGQQTAILSEDDLQDWGDQVNDGQATILRILAFSEAAKAASGKECRVEEMSVEEAEEDESEEDESEEDEVDSGDKWEIRWEAVK